MEKHGFVVLTDVGVIRQTYLEFVQLLKAFFEEPADAKESCKGAIHFNERGIPMVGKFVPLYASQLRVSCRKQRE